MIDLYAPVQAWLHRFLSGERWKWKATFWLVALSLFFQFPAYNYLWAHLTGAEVNPFWEHIQEQRHHLLTYTEQPPGSHLEKTTYRLTVPFLAWLFHLGTAGLYALQFLLGIALVWLTLTFCERQHGDPTDAFLFTAGLVFTYAGSAAFFDIWGQRDPFGYFFLVLALFTRNPWIAFGSTLLAGFADERALIASSLVLLHHSMDRTEMKEQRPARPRFGNTVFAVLCAWVVYLLLRFALSHFLGFRAGTGELGLTMFFRNLDQLLWGLWSGLEGQWLIVLVFAVFLWRSEQRYWCVLFLVGLTAVAATALLVDDTTRSMAYGFIVLFPAYAWLAHRADKRQVRVVLLFAVLVSLIHPLYFKLGTGSMIPVDPVFMKALHALQPHLGY